MNIVNTSINALMLIIVTTTILILLVNLNNSVSMLCIGIMNCLLSFGSFRGRVWRTGGSYVVTIPKRIVRELELKEGQEVTVLIRGR